MSSLSNITTGPQDITEEIIKFVDDNARNIEDISKPNKARDKLLQSINFVKDNDIHILFKTRTNDLGIYVSVQMFKYTNTENPPLKMRKIGTESARAKPVEIGSFEIDKLGIMNSMGISVDDDEDNGIYRNKGLSRLLIASMIYVLQSNVAIKLRNADLLYIDTDASAGFWDSIGMIENPHYENEDYVGPDKWYEKYITLQGLTTWALGNNHVIKIGGKKRKTIRKKTKNNKTSKKYKGRKVK